MVQSEEQSAVVSGQQVGRRVFRATGALLIIKGILRGFGTIEKMILGHVLGTGFATDAYLAARDIAQYLLQFVDQIIMHSFLPVFVQRMREQGEEDAWRVASTVINLLALLLTIVAGVGIIFARQIVPIFEPDWFNNAAHYPAGLVPLTILLTRIMLLAMVFLASATMTYCLLNSYKQFALPEAAKITLKVIVLAFAVILIRPLGPLALALGFVVGAAGQLLVQGFGLRRQVQYYRPVIDLKHPGVKQFWLLVLPLLVGVGLSTFRSIMDQRFASALDSGSWSALRFAKSITDVPVDFFPLAFGIALFPFLADIAASGNLERLRGMLMAATRMMVLIFLPLMGLFIVLRQPIVFLLYSQNSIGAADPLQIYAMQMLVGALEIIVLQFFFAMSDTLWPTIIAALMIPLHLAASYTGVFVFHWGVIGIALALLISKGVKVIVLYGVIRKRLGTLEGKHMLAFLGKVVLALLPLAALLLAVMHFFPYADLLKATVTHGHHGMMGKLRHLAHVVFAYLPYVGSGLVGLAIYAGLLHVLRVEEWHMLLGRVLGKLRKSAPPAEAA